MFQVIFRCRLVARAVNDNSSDNPCYWQRMYKQNGLEMKLKISTTQAVDDNIAINITPKKSNPVHYL